MKKKLAIAILFIIITFGCYASPSKTHRTPQFSNKLVNVWKTIIYPANNQKLPMHRHDFDRVVVPLSDGVLKITTHNGKVHYLKLLKNHAIYLTKDVSDELHSDENIGSNPITVMVIELKS